MIASPPRSQDLHGGVKSIWLHTSCLLEVHIGGRKQYGCVTRAFSGSPEGGDNNMATQLLPSRDPHRGQKAIWLHKPCLLDVPMGGGGGEAIWLHNPCHITDPKVMANQYGSIIPTF